MQSYKSPSDNGLDVQFSENYNPNNPDSAEWSDCTEGSGSCGKTGLAASTDGTSHSFVWDSYTDAGASEYSEVYVRFRAKDSAGDPGDWVLTDDFWVNNRPGKIDWIITYPYDKDTTPTIQAVIPYLRSGEKGFPSIIFSRRSDGETVLELNSFDSIENWRYEDDGGWNDLTAA